MRDVFGFVQFEFHHFWYVCVQQYLSFIYIFFIKNASAYKIVFKEKNSKHLRLTGQIVSESHSLLEQGPNCKSATRALCPSPCQFVKMQLYRLKFKQPIC